MMQFRKKSQVWDIVRHQMLRDRIISSLQDEGIQRKLQGEKQFTLVRATEIVDTMEVAMRIASNLRIAQVQKANTVFSKKFRYY